jgi:hypothetical protein
MREREREEKERRREGKERPTLMLFIDQLSYKFFQDGYKTQQSNFLFFGRREKNGGREREEVTRR